MLLGQLKETLGGLGRHRTNSGRTATVGHDHPSLCVLRLKTLRASRRVPFLLDGFGPDIREPPTDGSPGAKIKFKLDGTFQTFNPAFGVCVEPHWGIPRQTVGRASC